MTELREVTRTWNFWPGSFSSLCRLYLLVVSLGRNRTVGVFLLMPIAARAYVTGIVLAAVLCGAWIYIQAPVAPSDYAVAAIWFALLGLLANALAHELTKNASDSIAFIPFLASAVLAPSWVTVAFVASSMVLIEAAQRRALIKGVFNVAQYSLALGLGIAVYRAFGGRSLLDNQRIEVLPYIALFAVFLLVNTIAVSGAIAITQHRRVIQVWRDNTLSAFRYDVFSLPVVFFFAWAYKIAGAPAVAAIAIALIGLRQLYKTSWQLQQAHQELLELMVAAIEARDPYTSGHSRRVSRNAKAIARAIGLSGRHVERIGVAALLHDVGKIHEIFAPILRKADQLTPEEWTIMQTHPIKSAELVQKVSQLKDAVGSVRHHHENWDGSGYPDGLAGEEIPLGARIIMFADTIDAMTTDRPYRAALDKHTVRAEILRQRGKQFDPAICDKLLASPEYARLFEVAQLSTPFYSPVQPPSRRAATRIAR